MEEQCKGQAKNDLCDGDKKNAILELMEVTQMREALASQLGMFLDATLTASLPETLFDSPSLASQVRDVFKKYANVDAMAAIVADVYTEIYTLQEIEDMLVYHRSPTGQKAINMREEIENRTSKAGQQLVLDNEEKISKEVKELLGL